MIFHTAFTFEHVDKLPDVAEVGKIYSLSDGSTYAYTDKWEPIGSATCDKSWSHEPCKMLPTNCKNCGAILHGHTCEYCGTTYN